MSAQAAKHRSSSGVYSSASAFRRCVTSSQPAASKHDREKRRPFRQGKKLMRIIRSVRWAVLGLMLVVSVSSFAGVFISVGFGPPALPVYVQPPCPQVGFIWTPGYWGNGPDGYFWVPGTWVAAPQPGVLWTPGYWGWGGGLYAWHAGYWGPTIGFYGGVNYGFGYGGVGYEGGYWRGGSFYYNRSVNNVTSIHVTNVYNKTVIVNNNHVAFNGGEGGIQAHATPAEEAAANEHHIEATAEQTKHETAAASNRQLLASVNHGKPAIAATARPGVFSGRGVVAAKAVGAPYKPPAAAEAKAATAPKPANNAHPAAATTRNNVPRPPSSTSKATAPKPENTARPTSAEHSATPANNVPRPPSSTNKEAAARPASTPRPAPAAHTAAPTHNEAAARPAPKPAAPHPAAAPRPSAPPHPAAASHAAPAEKPREEAHPKGR
jgi:hypothetical protein